MNLIHSIDGNSNNYLVKSLRAGYTYRFRLQAENSLSLVSSYSTEQRMIAGTLPTAPSIPTIIDQSSSKITFSWVEPFDNGGTEILQYEILITMSQDGSQVSKIITNSKVYEFNFKEGLISGRQYLFKVRARNFYTNYFNKAQFAPWSAEATFYSSDLP